MMIVNILVMQW